MKQRKELIDLAKRLKTGLARKENNRKIYYHFSYDTISTEDYFEDSHHARRYILYILNLTNPISIISYNESSLIIGYTKKPLRLSDHLQNNLTKYFYYTLSKVDSELINNRESYNIWHNPNEQQNINLQKLLQKIDPKEFEKMKIKNY